MTATLWPQWLQQMTTGLARLDGDLCLNWVNSAFAEICAVGPRSILGWPISALIADQAVLRQLRKAQQEQRTVQLWAVLIGPYYGPGCSVDMAVQAGPDGAMYIELHPLHELSSRSEAPLSATLRGFAHEVKNPLAGLRGAAQLLARRVDDAALRELAQLVIAEADRLANLANRLLHHEGGQVRLSRVNLHQVLQRMQGLLAAQESTLQLSYDFDPSLPDTFGDADRLLQVMLNLAHNALQAGASQLSLRTRVEHSLRIGESQLRGCLRLDVIDDGQGVPETLRHSLFEPLVSGHPQGSGLGLALCREIMHEHGGELRYRSRPGETVFSLYLPRAERHLSVPSESMDE